MKITFPVLLVGALVLLIQNHETNANVVGFGACPAVAVPALAAGTNPFAQTPWFEQRRYPSRAEFLLRCVSYSFGVVAGAPATVPVTITGIRGMTRRTVSISGTLTQSAADAAANTFLRWSASFQSPLPLFPFFPSPFPSQYTIIAVDLVNAAPTWLVLYSCKSVGVLNLKNIYILTRLQNPAAAVISTAIAGVAAQNLPTNKLVSVTQVNC